uniref:Uncharacterized protein n=1 Tax=Zea mays TaxID=4577 RepID=C0PMB0_MAIZE|nr:unknown [Zea mays]
MLGVGILIMIAGVVTLIARGIGDVALGIEVQDTQTRRNQGAIHHTTELTTTVRIHLVKKIGIDTIDQGEEDPGFAGLCCMETTTWQCRQNHENL